MREGSIPSNPPKLLEPANRPSPTATLDLPLALRYRGSEMDKGIEVYICWDQPLKGGEILQAVTDFNFQEGSVSHRDEQSWVHEVIGDFRFDFDVRHPEMRSNCCRLTFYDCDLLPEFNEDDLKGQAAARAAYNFIKRMFIAIQADVCFGTTPKDGVRPFDFSDSYIDRIFRFTKCGPQRGVRPYEEDRLITLHGDLADIGRDPRTGEPNWVMRFEGPLTIPG